jgi:hypothetical protein
VAHVPTALQDPRGTSVSDAKLAPGGCETGSIAQAEPFQRSTSAVPASNVGPLVPTAMQQRAAGHDTDRRDEATAPLGIAGLCGDHVAASARAVPAGTGITVSATTRPIIRLTSTATLTDGERRLGTVGRKRDRHANCRATPDAVDLLLDVAAELGDSLARGAD